MPLSLRASWPGLAVNSSKRAIKDAKKLALKQGWIVFQGGNNHWHFIAPSGAIVITPSTPGGGNPRKFLNMRRDLRNAGLEGIL